MQKRIIPHQHWNRPAANIIRHHETVIPVQGLTCRMPYVLCHNTKEAFLERVSGSEDPVLNN